MSDLFDELISGSNAPRLRVSLRIMGDTLDPEFLSQQLGMKPAFSAKKGEPNTRFSSGELRETGIWVYRVHVAQGTELGEAIQALLDHLPEDSTLWEDLMSTFQVDVFCGVFLQTDNQSTVVGPEALAALNRRGLTLHLDMYSTFSSGADAAG